MECLSESHKHCSAGLRKKEAKKMSYFSHLYKSRKISRQLRGHNPDANRFGNLKAATFAKLYKQSNEWNDLRNITERSDEQRRKNSVGNLAEFREKRR